MSLDERYRQCVVLIGTAPVDREDAIDPWGTGFLIADNKGNDVYLVTAAHVVTDGDKLDALFDVRLNRNGGGAGVVSIENPKWTLHSDHTVDVAVHPIGLPDWAAYEPLPRSPNLSEGKRFRSKDIGAGNRTYTVGLWKFLHGDRRNQPFVYSGHIGLVPEDQRIPVDPWLPAHNGKPVLVEAYLVEEEPLDGASGSPVFVRRTLGPYPLSRSGKLKGSIEGSVWLLGLLSDAFKAKPGTDYEVPRDSRGVWIPRGVNVVVPSMKIMEVLDEARLRAQ